MKFIQSMLAFALASAMGSALAVTVAPGPFNQIGNLVGQTVSVGNTVAGSGVTFADLYLFNINSSSAEMIATAVEVVLTFGPVGSTPVYDISNFAIALQASNGVQLAFDNTFNTQGALELSAVLASATNYKFVVTGTTVGSSGGLYAGALSAQAVPEGKTYTMLLAGLGIVSLMVSRRSRGH